MIIISHGNLLTAGAEALANTVDTVGVMGKGIALQFKRAYPANYTAYRAACRAGEAKLGQMFVFDSARLGARRYVINFPTKAQLGCGNGGLDWGQIRPIIEEAFADLPEVRVLLYPPEGAPDPVEMPVVTEKE